MKYLSIYIVTQFAEVISKTDQFTINSYGRLISKNIINDVIDSEITNNVTSKLETYLNDMNIDSSKIKEIQNKLYYILPSLRINFNKDELLLPKLNQRIQYGIDLSSGEDTFEFVVNITNKVKLLDYLNYKIFKEI